MASSNYLQSCKIGQVLKEICHKLTLCRKTGFIGISDLETNQKKILEWRTEINFKNEEKICLHHEKVYLSGYESLQRKCEDPLSVHKKQITKSLRTVDEEKASQFNLKPGQKLCQHCWIRTCTSAMEEMDKTSDNEYVPLEESFASLNRAADQLGCSPIKSTSKRDRVAYSQKKVDKMQMKLKSKYAHALDLKVEELVPNKDHIVQSSQDLEELILNLKEKMALSTKREQLKLLTLVPKSWTYKKTIQEFKVTEHMVKKAHKMKKEHGILAEAPTKKGNPISAEMIKDVVEFYQLEEYTRICPGKKDYKTVKINNVKVCKQKQLLLVNIRELYIDFKQRNPNAKIGFSKFCELRPKWCIPVTSSGMHSVCVCDKHQNVKLMMAATPGNEDYKDLLQKIVCSTENRNCMIHLCELCPGKNSVEEYLTGIFTINDFDFDDTISYKQWAHTDRTTLVCLSNTVQEFVEIFACQLDKVREHHFIAKAQSRYLKDLKTNLSGNEAVVLLDFAENYSFIVQDAAQGYHWENSQATLHPFVVYYKADGELKSVSMCIVSDHLKHDTSAVHCFIRLMLSHIKIILPNIKSIKYFSDGSASQYKNYKNFVNLCHHKKDFGLDAEWHFFATSHGKSPCDGIGGTVKRLVARASLQAIETNHILTATDMFNWASSHIEGIVFFYVTSDDVLKNMANFSLPSRFDSASTISGTRSHHCFIPISESALQMKRISDDSNFSIINFGDSHNYLAQDTVDFEMLLPGRYVACMYDNEWYIGNIMEQSKEHNDLLISFMKKSSTAFFSWPSPAKMDQCWVPYHHIICIINAPELQGYGARCYKLNNIDKIKIERNLPRFI